MRRKPKAPWRFFVFIGGVLMTLGAVCYGLPAWERDTSQEACALYAIGLGTGATGVCTVAAAIWLFLRDNCEQPPEGDG